MLGKMQTIETLKQQVAALETNPVLQDTGSLSVPEGWLATPRGVLHEVFADGLADAGAALGFALAQARRMLTPERPGLLILQLKSDAQELGLPYGIGLGQFGLDTAAIVLIRTDTITELLWAIEEAVACRAVGAVVADIAYAHRALDFTTSRRLALRSAASAGAIFLVRYARDREASAARYRWHIAPSISRPPPFDDRAPGHPRWRVRLEKGSLRQTRRGTPDSEEYLVDWTADGFVPADQSGTDASDVSQPAALSHAAYAELGDRLPEAG